MSDTIEIKIDARKLTPGKFVDAVQAFFSLVQGVANNVAGDPVKWITEADKGSVIIRIRASNPNTKSKQSTEAVCRGLRSLRMGNRTIPALFTNEEVKAAKRLADLVDGERIQGISVKNGIEPELISKKTAESAEAILNGEIYQAFGSIEGKVDSLSDKASLVCSITDPIYGREITCYFTNDEAAEEAIKGFRKRVLAAGLIRYGKDGRPTSISVDKVKIFPDESDLPTVEQVQEIYKQHAI
jgi:hypothetical protein